MGKVSGTDHKSPYAVSITV